MALRPCWAARFTGWSAATAEGLTINCLWNRGESAGRIWVVIFRSILSVAEMQKKWAIPGLKFIPAYLPTGTNSGMAKSTDRF